MNDKPKIKHVYVFQNGMAIVFDTKGQQMPELQGPYQEVKERIESALRESSHEVRVTHNSN